MGKKIVIGVVVVLGLVLGTSFLYQTGKYKKIISEIEISNPDISSLQDGVYRGSFDAILVSAEVSVTIEGNKIKEVKIEKHNNGRGQAAEVITDKVVSEQSIEVDTISGATSSSKVILKAIENALNQENKK